MPSWNWSGILLVTALSLLLFGALLSTIQVDNPLRGQETSIIGWLIDIIVDAGTPSWWPF